MERLKLDPTVLSDPGGTGADELIQLLERLCSQFQDFAGQTKAFAFPVDLVAVDLREAESRRIFADQLHKGDLVLFNITSRDTDEFRAKFFFNQDKTMRLVIRESLPGMPRGRGGRWTWLKGIDEIYNTLRLVLQLESANLARAAGSI